MSEVTIKKAVDNIFKNDYLLPAIQREFVWSTYQIERLFDSLMKGYPIGSFLFWEVDKENIKKYQFYRFLNNYHEKDKKHNEKANLRGKNRITAILDGQQRLTSLYIGLKGTYASKISGKRWSNPDAFPEKTLCVNLLKPSEDYEFKYDFKFLTKEEMKERDENHFWFVVGKILDLEDLNGVSHYLRGEKIIDSEWAVTVLSKLCDVIKTPMVFFLEDSKELDKVLNIFIRINSGGTVLSYSDLLLSVATAHWKEKDARETITKFVDDINKIGDGFNANKDFVLKSCLALCDLDIVFKVDNFNQKNMLLIEENWEKISNAIRLAFELLNSFGYSRETLSSNNAVMPIAYYLYKIKASDKFLNSRDYEADRKNIFKWLTIVLIKGLFGGQSDNILKVMRGIISKSKEASFPLDEIIKKQNGTSKSLTFYKDDIENLVNHQYGQPHTFSVLALLYPTLDYKNKFHQDHIYPKRLFAEKNLTENGIAKDDIEFFMEKYNCVSNLQLIEGIPNQEKSGKDFSKWILERYPNGNEKRQYMERNYIPDVSLELKNFREFIEKREKLIIKKLEERLIHSIR